MAKKRVTCDLNSCFLCTKSLPEWIPAIAAHRKCLIFKKGQDIFSEGEFVKGIYFVYRGTVKVHKRWGEKQLIIRFAREGSIFGHRGLGTDPHYPISATALTPVTACYIDLHFFQTSLRVNPDLLYHLLLFFTDELQESERKMRNLAHMQVKGRVAQALLQLRDQFGTSPEGHIGLTLSRQDLASLVGATYETVFRFINELAEEGLIRVENKDLAILDDHRLNGYTRE
ncbi:MAG TPA: Crp/Fnr family transcriptional regulator [Puia sp.]|nr:Crp/Fnr family transcriptional regulator [Puia sp.]